MHDEQSSNDRSCVRNDIRFKMTKSDPGSGINRAALYCGAAAHPQSTACAAGLWSALQCLLPVSSSQHHGQTLASLGSLQRCRSHFPYSAGGSSLG